MTILLMSALPPLDSILGSSRKKNRHQSNRDDMLFKRRIGEQLAIIDQHLLADDPLYTYNEALAYLQSIDPSITLLTLRYAINSKQLFPSKRNPASKLPEQRRVYFAKTRLDEWLTQRHSQK